MPTLKEAIIDFGDCNTSLGHLKPGAVQGPLSLGTEEGYRQLYQQILGGVDYAELRGQEGVALRRLKPAYRANKYWQRFFGGDSPDSSPEIVWDSLVPIEARLKLNLQVSWEISPKIKVSPVPYVLIYPFGWSTWISLRITGEHSLEDLANLAFHFATNPAYSISADTPPLDLGDLLKHIARGVWEDAFGGGAMRASSPPERLSVITVLDKYGGAVAIDALEETQGPALRRLVQPGSSPSQRSWQDLVLGLPQGGTGSGNIDYVLQDSFGHFIWADHKLKSEGTNQQDLRCYHNNTFRSLIHGWHLVQLLDQASTPRNRTIPIVTQLVTLADYQIQQQLATKSLYRNVSQLSYFKRPETEAIRQNARQVFKLGGKEE